MKNKILITILFGALLLINSQGLRAQSSSSDQDPLQKYIYPPELIMNNQQKIGLSDEQREMIIGIVSESQEKFNVFQWDLQSQSEVFVGIIKQENVDEVKALEQLDKILALEEKIKKTQISLFIRIKNQLTPEQQNKLNALKNGY
ncbi:MAG: hypothetical protein HKN68_11310 [Saprospiraceae bacterium]|nr:hypothetical protein [Saprospiraceae bacterium]